MPTVIEQLREIQSAMPKGTEVSLSISHRHHILLKTREMPPETTEVLIAIQPGTQSFFVEDWEWEKGKIAEELIGHMQKIIQEKRLA